MVQILLVVSLSFFFSPHGSGFFLGSLLAWGTLIFFFNVNSCFIFLFWLNDIALNCRSLFVPYFKYVLENSVHYLTVAGDAKPSGSMRKKKAKILESDNSMFLGNWHLRALILSSLHKCFLYDTGSLKFLDSSNFQVSPSFIFQHILYKGIYNLGV